MAIQRTGHVAIRVRDLDATRRFYCDVVGMKVAHEASGRGVFFRFDTYHHDIVAFKADGVEPASPRHAGVQHIALVADDFATLRAHFRRAKDHGLPVRCTDHGFTKSIYFPDPDGIELEIYVEVPAFDIRVEGMDFREPFDIEAPDAAEPLRRPR